MSKKSNKGPKQDVTTSENAAPIQEVVAVESQAQPEVPPVPAPTSESSSLTIKLPKKGKEKQRIRITVQPGEIGKIKIGNDELPFSLPPDITEPTVIAVATPNISWLGREGGTPRFHVCESENGVVVLMPQTDKSWKANAFSKGKISYTKIGV